MKFRNYPVFPLTVILVLSAAAAMAGDTTIDGGGTSSPLPGESDLSAPVLMIDFDDTITMHNMGIASDGTYYYTCNGGTASSGQINTYDINGVFISSVACLIDMRAVFYNSADGKLYAKTYTNEVYEVNPTTGGYTFLFGGGFSNAQSSPALTPDGLVLLEHDNGTVRFFSFPSGTLIDTISGFACGGAPSSYAIGTDGTRIFTWNGSLVYVYDMTGTLIESYTLPSGNYGFSLKFVNGLLFASVDGGGGTGHWYGYYVGETALERSSWGSIKGMFL